MQTTSTPARGENPSIQIIDELPFFKAGDDGKIAVPRNVGKTVALTDDQVAKIVTEEESSRAVTLTADMLNGTVPAPSDDTPIRLDLSLDNIIDAEGKEELHDMYIKSRQDFVNFLEKFVKDLRSTNTQNLFNQSITDAQRKKAAANIMSLDLLEDNAEIMRQVGTCMPPNFASVATSRQLMQKFGSLVRVNRIPCLKYKDTLSMIKKIENADFRRTMLLMFNAVMQFIIRNPKSAGEREMYIRLQFMVMKYAVRLNHVPVLADKLRDEYMPEIKLTSKK
jgi:hypothetical protein